MPENRGLAYSVSTGSVGRLGKDIITSIILRAIIISNNKKNAGTNITDIVCKYFMNVLEYFKDLPYISLMIIDVWSYILYPTLK